MTLPLFLARIIMTCHRAMGMGAATLGTVATVTAIATTTSKCTTDEIGIETTTRATATRSIVEVEIATIPVETTKVAEVEVTTPSTKEFEKRESLKSCW